MCQNWFKLFQWFYRRWICLKFTARTTKMTTTDNGQILIRKDHLSSQLRWAKKEINKLLVDRSTIYKRLRTVKVLFTASIKWGPNYCIFDPLQFGVFQKHLRSRINRRYTTHSLNIFCFKNIFVHAKQCYCIAIAIEVEYFKCWRIHTVIWGISNRPTISCFLKVWIVTKQCANNDH